MGISLEMQKMLKEDAKRYLKSVGGSLAINLQDEFFVKHQDHLKRSIKSVLALMKDGKFPKNEVVAFPLAKDSNNAIQMICFILRDDGGLYFGLNPSIAVYGLGGRVKNEELEFYYQYKEELLNEE